MKKRIIAIIFCFLMVFLAACGEKENNSNIKNKTSSNKQSQSSSQGSSKENDEDNKEPGDTNDKKPDAEVPDKNATKDPDIGEPDDNANKEPDNGDVEETNIHWNDDGVLKILAIGNSFSVDTMQYVYNIAANSGVEKIVLGNLYIGGCSLQTHFSNAKTDKAAYTYYTNTTGSWKTTSNYKISTAVTSDNWDFISLQQVSNTSGQASSYSVLSSLIGYLNGIKDKNTEIVWNMTWAYQSNSNHSAFVNYNKNQLTMYEGIVEAVKKAVVADNGIEIVIPAGTAIQNARTSYVGDTLTRDGYHLSNDLGRYIAGLAFFHKLTGVSIENLTYAPSGVDQKERAVAIESAINAVKNPYEVTSSTYQNP